MNATTNAGLRLETAQLINKVDDLLDSLEAAIGHARDLGWDFNTGLFEDSAHDRIHNLYAGPLLERALWEVLYGVGWGSDSPTEKGWLRVDEDVDTARRVLDIVDRRNPPPAPGHLSDRQELELVTSARDSDA